MNLIRSRSFTRQQNYPPYEKRYHASRGRGFTLVELLVVIAIIGLLVALPVGRAAFSCRAVQADLDLWQASSTTQGGETLSHE